MKKFKLVLLSLILSLSSISVVLAQSNEQPPSWYLEHTEFYEEYGDNIIIGTGQAKGRTVALAEKVAFATAQANAAQQIEVIISKYEGGLKTQTSIKLPTNYCKVLKKYISKDGTVYLAIMVDKDKVLNLNGIQE